MTDKEQLKTLTKAQKDKVTELIPILIEQGYSDTDAVEISTELSIKLTKSRKKVSDVTILKSFNDEEMIALEVIYEPNVLDTDGNWATPDTLQKACDNFNENLEKGKVSPNLYHLLDTPKFEISKTWIVQEDSTIGENLIKSGTWVGEFKFLDEALWENKKSGVLGGVSIGAKGKIGYGE